MKIDKTLGVISFLYILSVLCEVFVLCSSLYVSQRSTAVAVFHIQFIEGLPFSFFKRLLPLLIFLLPVLLLLHWFARLVWHDLLLLLPAFTLLCMIVLPLFEFSLLTCFLVIFPVVYIVLRRFKLNQPVPVYFFMALFLIYLFSSNLFSLLYFINDTPWNFLFRTILFFSLVSLIIWPYNLGVVTSFTALEPLKRLTLRSRLAMLVQLCFFLDLLVSSVFVLGYGMGEGNPVLALLMQTYHIMGVMIYFVILGGFYFFLSVKLPHRLIFFFSILVSTAHFFAYFEWLIGMFIVIPSVLVSVIVFLAALASLISLGFVYKYFKTLLLSEDR